MAKQAYLYILSNASNSVMAMGITTGLKKFMGQARQKSAGLKLVYYEILENPDLAMQRERQLQTQTRQEKAELINRHNPNWLDLQHLLEE